MSVKGRYYRVAHDANNKPLVPAYQGPTLFDSAQWLDRNFPLVRPPLGEVGNNRPWDNGAPPILPPSPIQVGSSSCIATGEPIASGLTIASPLRFGSWPAACYVVQPIDNWGRWAAVYRCPIQLWWAERLVQLNAGQIGPAISLLRLAFPEAVVRWWAGERFFPPTVTIVAPSYAIVILLPTQTAEQALIEVIEGVLGPTDRGGLSTTLLWYQFAQVASRRLALEGANGTNPLLCVGYSYGGASAQVLAAICRLQSRTRLIRYLTFGAPRSGDARLAGLLGLPTRGCALANDNDAITAIPPGIDQILPAQGVLARVLLPYARWRPSRETWMLRPNGVVVENAYPTLSTGELVALLQHVWTTGTFFGYPAHQITEYQRRLALRCTVPNPNLGPGIVGIGGPFPGRLVARAWPVGQAVGIVGRTTPASGAVGVVGSSTPGREAIGLFAYNWRGSVGTRGYTTPQGRVGLERAKTAAGLVALPNIIGGRKLGLAAQILPHGAVTSSPPKIAGGCLSLSAPIAGHGACGINVARSGKGSVGFNSVTLQAPARSIVGSGTGTPTGGTFVTASLAWPAGLARVAFVDCTSISQPQPSCTLGGTPMLADFSVQFSTGTPFYLRLSTFSLEISSMTASLSIATPENNPVLWCAVVITHLNLGAVDVPGSSCQGQGSVSPLTLPTISPLGSAYEFLWANAAVLSGTGTSSVTGWASPLTTGVSESINFSGRTVYLVEGFLGTTNLVDFKPSVSGHGWSNNLGFCDSWD